MATEIIIDPVTRIEGHLKITLTVDQQDGYDQIIDAKSSGTMFRGFEKILQGRDPLDAPHLTQRICGVCPISHGMAASLNLEAAFDMTPPENGRILRNLVLGANFLQSHVLHFYHLAALDYINTTGMDNISKGPWNPHYVTPDMVTGGTAAALVGNYVEALAIRRKAHQMGAIFGGKQPCSPTMGPGGCTEVATTESIDAYRTLLNEIIAFIDNKMLPDVAAVASVFGEYAQIGKGSGNLLAYGVFDTDTSGGKLLTPGLYRDIDGLVDPNLDVEQIIEYVGHSKFTAASGNLNPADGVTEPDADKPGAYSWLKSPRYQGDVFEVGPLARMVISGNYSGGVSVIHRIDARAQEAQLVAYAMLNWLDELVPGDASYAKTTTPNSGYGMGLTEAPRGALGHWIDIQGGEIARYQVVTPTNWNASPMDDALKKGPIEQALIGTPIADISQPIEALRVVHSFDPCLACSVHMLRPGKKAPEAVVETSIGF